MKNLGSRLAWRIGSVLLVSTLIFPYYGCATKRVYSTPRYERIVKGEKIVDGEIVEDVEIKELPPEKKEIPQKSIGKSLEGPLNVIGTVGSCLFGVL